MKEHKLIGRPQLMLDGKKVTLYLDKKTTQLAEKLGKGNMSAGVRRSLEIAAKIVEKYS